MDPAPAPKLRIAIDGAQSTGKTTLAAALQLELGPRMRLIPDAARAVALASGVATASDWEGLLADRHRLELFFGLEETWQASQEARPGSFVADGSRALIAAYRAWLDCAPPRLVGPLYDLVLYCGIDIPFVEDGFRFSRGRVEVDALYRARYAATAASRFVCVPPGAGRLPAAMAAVNQLAAPSLG